MLGESITGLQPSDVFTPTRLPLRETNVYSRRLEPETQLERTMRLHQVPLVYGEYGVGKTSLVKKFFADVDAQRGLVHVPTASRKTYADIVSICLEHLDYRVETHTREIQSGENSGGKDIKVLSGRRARTESVEEQFELVVRDPTDRRLIEILAETELTLVVDEMHKADALLRSALLDLIKAVNTLDLSYPRIALVGTAHDAHDLVHIEPGVDRIVKELEVPLMDREEALFIVTEGMAKLGLEISNELAELTVQVAARVPSIIHSLCLDAAEQCIADQRVQIQKGDLYGAVKQYLRDHGKRLYVGYMQAIPTTGSRRYRKLVLHAVAAVDGEYATMDQITEYASRELGVAVPSTALSGPLRQLKEDLGRPLKDVERVDRGGNVRNLTAFRNPMMKFFVRFMANAQQVGALTELPDVTQREIEEWSESEEEEEE